MRKIFLGTTIAIGFVMAGGVMAVGLDLSKEKINAKLTYDVAVGDPGGSVTKLTMSGLELHSFNKSPVLYFNEASLDKRQMDLCPGNLSGADVATLSGGGMIEHRIKNISLALVKKSGILPQTYPEADEELFVGFPVKFKRDPGTTGDIIGGFGMTKGAIESGLKKVTLVGTNQGPKGFFCKYTYDKTGIMRSKGEFRILMDGSLPK